MKKHHQLLWTLGILIGIVGIWRGTWKLFDMFVFPQSSLYSALASLALGVSIIMITHYKLSP